MAKEMLRAHVLIPHELLEKVDKLVGRRRRSQFLTEALREKLGRMRLSETAERAAGSLADANVPGWESSEAAAEWVREQRRADEHRTPRITKSS